MDEWPVLAKIAVAALILIIIAAAVFFFVNTTLGAANRSGEKLSSTITSLDSKVFDQYDQTVIPGTQVVSAISNFKNQPVAVLVRTKGNSATAGPIVNYDGYLDTPDGTGAPSAVPDGWDDYYNTAKIKLDLAADSSYMDADALAIFQDYQNGNYTYLGLKSHPAYINNGARFNSRLIKTLNGEIIGIFVEQVGVDTPIIE